MCGATLALVLMGIGTIGFGKPEGKAGAGRPDAGAPSDMRQPLASRVSRAVSDAWHYNELQSTVLESQKARIVAELARLAAEKETIRLQLKNDFAVDVAAGDTFDEHTLEIRRK